MITTIDTAGRLVIPKALRDAVGLVAGEPVEIHAVAGRLEIEVPATPMRLERQGDSLVAVTDVPMPTLTAETVRATLDSIRR
jgi:AbrB family looped-hinge helix DNA binding protein